MIFRLVTGSLCGCGWSFGKGTKKDTNCVGFHKWTALDCTFKCKSFDSDTTAKSESQQVNSRCLSSWGVSGEVSDSELFDTWESMCLMSISNSGSRYVDTWGWNQQGWPSTDIFFTYATHVTNQRARIDAPEELCALCIHLFRQVWNIKKLPHSQKKKLLAWFN